MPLLPVFRPFKSSEAKNETIVLISLLAIKDLSLIELVANTINSKVTGTSFFSFG